MNKKLSDYPQPSVAVDLPIFSIIDGKLSVLLAQRHEEPGLGLWALPGGFVKVEESLEEAVVRKLMEETGLSDIYFEQLYTFGDVERDTRGRVIAVAYFALVNSKDPNLKLSKDKDVKWFSVDKHLKFPFDHDKIFEYALKRLKWKFEYTTVAISLLSEEFTLSELKSLYESVFNREFDKRNFYKKINSLDILDEKGIQKGAPNRPAMLYSLKTDAPQFVNMF